MDLSPNMRMIDIGDKGITARQAVARGRVVMKSSTYETLKKGGLPKGDALAAARIAGIMAAKETHRLIPMCHPLLIEEVTIDFSLDESTHEVEITAMAKGSGKTGFEMEALTALTISALTIYDMCKAVDPGLRLQDIRLVEKSGGKSGKVVLE